jgi:hypothetical protein
MVYAYCNVKKYDTFVNAVPGKVYENDMVVVWALSFSFQFDSDN